MWDGWKMKLGEHGLSKENFLAYVKSVPVEHLLGDQERKYSVYIVNKSGQEICYKGGLLPLLIFFKQYKRVRELIEKGVFLSDSAEERRIWSTDIFIKDSGYVFNFDAFWDMLKDCRFNDDCIRVLYERMEVKPCPFESLTIGMNAIKRLHSLLPVDIKDDLKRSKEVNSIYPSNKTFCDIYLYYAEILKDDNEGLSLLLDSMRECICTLTLGIYPANKFWYALLEYYECTEELKKKFLALAYRCIIDDSRMRKDGLVNDSHSVDLKALSSICPGKRVMDSDMLNRMLYFGGFDYSSSLELVESFDSFEVDENLAYQIILGCYRRYVSFNEELHERTSIISTGIERSLISEEIIQKWCKNSIETEDYEFGIFLLEGIKEYRRDH